MATLQKTTLLDDLVVSGRWKSSFSWGNMIPDKITTLSHERVDYNGNKLSLKVIEQDSIGFFYEDVSRVEIVNNYSSGAFITEDTFAFGTFLFDISFGMFSGLNIIAGLFDDNFSNSIIGFKKTLGSNFFASLKDIFSVKTAIRSNNNTLEGSQAQMTYRNLMNAFVRIDWIPGSVSIRINDKLILHTVDEQFVPTEAMKFGLILTLDDCRIKYKIDETIFLTLFKYIPYESKNHV